MKDVEKKKSKLQLSLTQLWKQLGCMEPFALVWKFWAQ